MTTWVRDYLRLAFQLGGRARPNVDCWGLYRLIIGEQRGVWLDEFGEVETNPYSVARTLLSHQKRGWEAVPHGQEREFDLALMRGIVGRGRGSRPAPSHVGCVIAQGRLIDIEDVSGARVRAYTAPPLSNRLIGLFRPAVLA